MIVKIINNLDNDYIIVECDNIDDMMYMAINECNRMGWLIEDCYTETIEE